MSSVQPQQQPATATATGSAIACFLGRLCNRRLNNSKPAKQTHNNNFRSKEGRSESGNHHSSRPNSREAGGSRHELGNNSNSSFRTNSKEGGGDIEFGFDMRIPNGKPPNALRSDSRGHNHQVHHHENGDHDGPKATG
ncbi:hypothetical protein FNV43_RR25999 [Rhamnella rubrinervis]|uniref:Uncharacterized protein n=1 Tax=Rhamnella rubrinervis TaxID=2594499 RepID=A0A8K0DNG1_9ROSA|nr:hypothetical protein FNV43_RR25999 [Rhamnella rubrinervis]